MHSKPLKPATKEVMHLLRQHLPDDVFGEFSKTYQSEPRGRFACSDAELLLPRCTDDVSKILMLCNDEHVPVIPYGGGTGLVGGQIGHDIHRPIVVSLNRMNKIRNMNASNNMVTVEAGCILQDLHNAAQSESRMFPLTISSRGTCQIGGNLATNAGGINVVRYGSMRDLCLGIEAVFANGEILNGLSSLLKDNHGYNIKDLLIGSEGTLAIITAANLKLVDIPQSETTGLFILRDLASALDLLNFTRDELGDRIAAFELISGVGLSFIREAGFVNNFQFDSDPQWMVLLEVSATGREDIQDRVIETVNIALEKNIITDGIIATSEKQRSDLWSMRDLLPEANRRIGTIASHDISLPVEYICEFVEKAHLAINNLSSFRINCFGHVGDGNLHYNVLPEKGSQIRANDEIASTISNRIYDLVRSFNGSIAAEHGTGRLKAHELEHHCDKATLVAYHAIKNALDPNGILNPGSVLLQ